MAQIRESLDHIEKDIAEIKAAKLDTRISILESRGRKSLQRRSKTNEFAVSQHSYKHRQVQLSRLSWRGSLGC
jgi:hypothetical protein